jgi:hypothetical protein
MIHNRKNMSCEEFSACMADLIAAGQDIFAHPHVRKCKLHRALLDDLETIARAAKEMFPEVDPADSVWTEIQARMAQEPHPNPMVSQPFPGYRVVVAVQVVEHGSPPAIDHSFLDDKSSFGLQILGAASGFPRREGADDR